MIIPSFHILAAAEDETGKVIFAVVAVVIWAISALAKQAGKSTQKQKERLRQVRESIERAHAQNQPVTLDPEIARRLPPMVPQRPPVARKQQVPRPVGRPATDYNQMTAQPRITPPPIAGQRIPAPPMPIRPNPNPPRPAAARPKRAAAKRPAGRPPLFSSPPPIAAATAQPAAAAILLPESPRPIAAAAPRPAARPPLTAASVKRWATPATLRQQFILTEIFQPPLAMREEHLR